MDKKNEPEFISTPIDAELDLQKEQKQETIEFNLNSRRNERIVAFNLIYAVDRSSYEMHLSEILQNFERGFHLEVPEDSFVLKLTQGTIACRKELDDQIKPHLKNWKIDRLGCCTRLILRMALWELQQAKAVPSIIINEAVELAKMFAEKDAYKFINGILDEISKKEKGDNDGCKSE